MNRTSLLFASLTALSSLSLAGQQPAAPSTASGTETAVPVASTANSPEAENNQLRPVNGELVGKLDSKSAKTGDSVVIKTTQEATTASGTVIPKGSKIVGHVTDVQAHEKGNDNGKVTIQFDQAQLKDGQNLAIKSVIQSVGSPQPQGVAGQVDAFGTGAPGAMGGPGAGAPATATGNMSAGAQSNTAQAQGPPQGSTAAVTPGAAPSGPQPAGTVISQQGNVAIRTTDVPGVLLASNTNGQPFSNASGALLGARQNVKLDGGTKMVLAVEDVSGKSVR